MMEEQESIMEKMIEQQRQEMRQEGAEELRKEILRELETQKTRAVTTPQLFGLQVAEQVVQKATI
jgi:hypothetical protein